MTILVRYEAVVEIIFAVALFIALVYSIYMGDKVTAAAVIGGILGYMKGRSDSTAPASAAPLTPRGAAGEAGFMTIRLLFVVMLFVLSLLVYGCASVTQNITCGEQGRDVKQTTTDKTALDGNSAQVSPNVSLVPK